jgi:hypothetical protein
MRQIVALSRGLRRARKFQPPHVRLTLTRKNNKSAGLLPAFARINGNCGRVFVSIVNGAVE